MARAAALFPLVSCHMGLEGFREDLAAMMGLDDDQALLSFVRLLALKKPLQTSRPARARAGCVWDAIIIAG